MTATPPRPSPAPARRRHRTERRFGLSVGGVLLVLGGLAFLRGKHPAAVAALAGLGALLFGFGLGAPAWLATPNRLWMGLAEGLGFVMSRVILSAVFFLVLTPIALVRRLLGADALRRRSGPRASYWVDSPAGHRDPKHYEKLY